MNEHPTTDDVLHHPERIPGYSYGTDATPSPLTLDELTELVAAVGLTESDEATLRAAGEVLAPRAAEMVDAWRSQVGRHPFLARYSAHRDGTPNPEYAAASTLAVRPLGRSTRAPVPSTKPGWINSTRSACATTAPRRTRRITPTPPTTFRCGTCWPSPRSSSPPPAATSTTATHRRRGRRHARRLHQVGDAARHRVDEGLHRCRPW